MNFFWVNEKIFLVVCFFQFVYAYIISDHLPFDVAENVFCCGQFFYVNRHESNLFAILCYLFFVQVFFYVREFVKSCQKSFCWSFANSDLVFISQDEYCLFFDSSCFCFFFYWKRIPPFLFKITTIDTTTLIACAIVVPRAAPAASNPSKPINR